MVRSFVFSNGKLVGKDLGLDFLKVVLFDEDAQIWVDLDRPTAEEAKSLLEGVFNFHPLSIEDCVAVSEQPKIEEYESYVFLVLHAVEYSASLHQFQTHELNLFMGKNFLVTYHDQALRSVDQTIERVMKNAAAVARAPDRLSYTILDLLLDSYDPALANLSAEFADLDQSVMSESAQDILNTILRLKKEVHRLRMIVLPQRELVARLARGEFKLVRAHLLPYYRDLLDRLTRINDLTEHYRLQLTDTLQVHLNLQQMQVNRVIKVLTVLATLSMPIVVITSYYGMNFRNFGELDIRFPHLWVFGLSALLTSCVYIFLRKKRWL